MKQYEAKLSDKTIIKIKAIIEYLYNNEDADGGLYFVMGWVPDAKDTVYSEDGQIITVYPDRAGDPVDFIDENLMEKMVDVLHDDLARLMIFGDKVDIYADKLLAEIQERKKVKYAF